MMGVGDSVTRTAYTTDVIGAGLPSPLVLIGSEEITIDLVIDTHPHGAWQVVAVKGELDLATAPQLRDAILQLSVGGQHRVIADMTEVGFVDSSGLGVLVGSLKHLRELGGELALVAPESSPLSRLLDLTGLDRSMPAHPSVDAVAD